MPLLYALALALAVLLVYGFYLRGHLPVGADNTLFYAPFYAMRWHGGPPLWNPYSLSGTSLVDNLQAALLYPLRWPFFFIADWRDYFGIFVFLHYFVALTGMAGLLRAMGLRRLAALGGAIVFALGGHMAGRIINPTIFQASCWLPWLLWGAVGRRTVHAWLTILAATMIFTIGSPHLIFYGTIVYVLIFTLCTFLPRWREEITGSADALVRSSSASQNSAFRIPHSAFSMAFHRAIGLLLAFLLASPTLLPGVLRAQSSIRTHSTVETNLADSATLSEIPRILLGGVRGTPVYPEYIDLCCYIGPVALALAAWVALRRRSWRDPRFHAALLLIAVGLFFALGKHAGVQYILPWIPVIRNLAGASRALVLTAAGLAILTALALDALTARPTRRLGAAFLALAVLTFAALAAMASRHSTLPLPETLATLARPWAVAPAALEFPWFPLLDAVAGLAAAGAILLLPARLDRLRLGLLCALLFALCWHFAPRVFPPTEQRPFFEPPPQVAFLQAERDRLAQSPFRVAGYDPLRLHDCEFDTPHKFPFLMPNMATLYRLEDINGFDPLILIDYLNLFLSTSGRAPHNDPIRNLDLARPNLRLFDMLGVRFLAGHPHDRRLTTIPLEINADRPEAEVTEWTAAPLSEPVTHWLFVGLLNRALRLPLGAEVARLHVEAAEGTFDFPLRNGEELADWNALNTPLVRAPGFRAVVNKEMVSHTLDPDWNYQLRNAFYRGAIAFGKPLHIRRASWRLVAPGAIVHLAAQAYRLAPPPGDPWILRFGAESDVAPVYEYRDARPRAVLLPPAAVSAAPNNLDLNLKDEKVLNAAPDQGAIRWRERGENALALAVKTEHPALLVLREIWDAGWHAQVGGVEKPVLRVGGLLRGVELPAGQSEVRLNYRPRLPRLLGLFAAVALVLYLAGLIVIQRRRRQK